MNNNIVETQEAENEINSIEKNCTDTISSDNSSKQGINPIFAKEAIPYYDPSVLLTNSKELELVNYYFDSVSCHNKGIANLLREMMGYSLAETTKLNKLFILKGDGRNGKSKIFRVLEAILGEKRCSHEHLEQLSRK